MSDLEAPVSGALSIDDAIAHLNDHDEPQVEAPQAAAEPEVPQSEGETSAPEEPAAEAETQSEPGAEEQADEPAATPLDPPLYWKPEAKAKFAQLDPDLQAEILAQEGPREQAAAKAKAEAAAEREAAEKEVAGIREFAEKVQPLLAQVRQTFASRWGENPDWMAYAQQYGAEAMTLAKTQYDAERQQLQGFEQAAQAAQQKAHQEYVRGEFERLKTVAPELADPEKGAERRAEVTKYLQAQGIPDTALVNISAVEMSMARKAMLYDRLEAKAAQPLIPPRPTPPQTRPLTRGAASAGSVDPKVKAAQTAKNRFAQTRSIDDAIALLNMQGE